jgi:hypothetical protein
MTEILMVRKKIVCALLAVMMMAAVCGCAASESASEKAENSTSMFVPVESDVSWTVVYQKDTKVMYAVSRGTYNRGTFTVLLNADGTPMLYEGG